MRKIIISDTSCLILLEKIGQLQILKNLFGEVIVTSIIADEFGMPLPEWILIRNPINETFLNILKVSVDIGEASAIAYAIEQGGSLLILDDRKARKLANELNIKYTGTIAILLDAKQAGHIEFIKPMLQKIKQTNFRISPELEKLVLEKAGELNQQNE